MKETRGRKKKHQEPRVALKATFVEGWRNEFIEYAEDRGLSLQDAMEGLVEIAIRNKSIFKDYPYDYEEIQFRLPEKKHKALKSLAKKTGLSVGEILKKVLK
jgi:hypothetical protein